MLILICLLDISVENTEKILEHLSLKLRKEIGAERYKFWSKKHINET